MTDDLPQSAASNPPPRHPPAPRALWILFCFGLTPICAIGCMFCVGSQNLGTAAGVGAFVGLILSAPMAGGLALAIRLFRGTGARIAGGLIFAVMLLVSFCAVVFAGCMCVLAVNNHRA